MITSDADIFLRLDVGKTDHWTCVVTVACLPGLSMRRIADTYPGLGRG